MYNKLCCSIYDFTIIYYFSPGDDDINKFSINAVSGLIETTAIALDRETRGVYDLVVSVTDSGTPSRMVGYTVLCKTAECAVQLGIYNVQNE